MGRYLNSQTEVKRITDLCNRAASEHVVRSYSAPTTAPKRLSPAINQRIAELYKEGMRPADIARDIGTTEWTVHHRLNRMGIERRPTGLSPTQVREAMRLYESGDTLRKISFKLGFNDKTIKKALIEAGVSVPTSYRASRS